MAWKHYLLVFRLQSPLHIGYRKVGSLMQTRRYVPGKNLWAGLTQRIVWRMGQAHNPDAYRRVGDILRAHFRFGYLWPAHAPANSSPPQKPHFPWEKADPAYWDYLYLDGIASTAQDSSTRTAAEGTLHQVEFIAPYTREGQPVYLVGDLWVDEAAFSASNTAFHQAVQEHWQAALQRLQLGGERSYGWGQMTLAKCDPTDTLCWGEGWLWKEQDSKVKIIIKQEESRLPMHALAVKCNENDVAGPAEEPVGDVKGPVEPLLGWERQRAGHSALSMIRIAYEPGARAGKNLKAEIAPWGYLRGL